MPIEHRDGSCTLLLCGHLDEAVPFGPARRRVPDDLEREYPASFLEQRPEFAGADMFFEVADVQFA